MTQVDIESLRGPQIRLIRCLAGPLSRKQWASLAKVDNASCTEYIGSMNQSIRDRNDEKHFPSLMGLNLVKSLLVETETGSEVHYCLTELGESIRNDLNREDG